jgi:transposase-like protein
MEAKLLADVSSGLPLDVSSLCRELGVSRQTFNKYRRRWMAEVPAGRWNGSGGSGRRRGR